MGSKNLSSIIILIVIVAIIAGGVVYIWEESKIKGMKTDSTIIGQICKTKAELCSQAPGIIDGWEKYFQDNKSTELVGKPAAEIEQLLGVANESIKGGSRQIWAYLLPQDKATAKANAVIVYFENNAVSQAYLDQYSGSEYLCNDRKFLIEGVSVMDLKEGVKLDFKEAAGVRTYTVASDKPFGYQLSLPAAWKDVREIVNQEDVTANEAPISKITISALSPKNNQKILIGTYTVLEAKNFTAGQANQTVLFQNEQYVIIESAETVSEDAGLPADLKIEFKKL